MNLFFLIAPEGCGHNLFEDACSYEQTFDLHHLLMAYFDNEISLETKSNIKNNIHALVAANPNLNHIERSSFPYGYTYLEANRGRTRDGLRGPIRRYDVKEFYDLFSEIAEVNLFFIILTRNIVRSTLSTYERFHVPNWDNDIIWASKIHEDNWIYINSQAQLLPSRQRIIVDYDDVCANIKTFEISLQDLSGISDISFDESKVKQADHSKALSHPFYSHLENYFDKKRMSQFDFLKENKTTFQIS